jgi:pyruvate dehydrogenase E2 component (dihydrolipoamide acetyltransferase)
MLTRVVGLAFVIGAFASATFAQAQAPAPPQGQAPPPAQEPAPAPAQPAAPAAPGQGQAPARGAGGIKAGQTGNPDPGVNFLVIVENPHVRVLQVTLQPGAVRRPHVHNDVIFHMLVPVSGSLDLTIEKDPVVTTVPGQAYYMVKGQTHGFTNKSSSPVQVIELFIKPDPASAPPAAGAAAPPAAPPATAPAATTPAAPPATPPPPAK